MPILGPFTGEREKPYSYLLGPHWSDTKGYRVTRGYDTYHHRFGGQTWKVPLCKNCHEPLHQIFTFDLRDPRLQELYTDGLLELPLVSCLNCSTAWEPQLFRLNVQDKEVEVLLQEDTQNWVQKDEDKIPSLLPSAPVKLAEMHREDIPVDRQTYNRAFELIGHEYLCRILGAPLYAQHPLDRKCPICKTEMVYVATLVGENYGESGQFIPGLDFVLGEMYLYFLLCKNCLVVKTESQGT